MFNWTNVTVINSGTDTLSGLPKFSGESGKFKVARINAFDTNCVTSLYKRAGYASVKSTATFTTPTAPSTSGAVDFYRISLFMKLVGSQDSSMATAGTIYKSKPMHIEFKVENGQSASTIADNMVKAVRYYQQNMYPYIKAEKVSNALKITTCDEFEVFNSAVLEKLVVNTTSVYPEDINNFVKVSSATIVNGKPGFGTYTHILHNLRLPTIENTRYGSQNEEEMPIMGGIYTQYTLEYKKNRHLMGGGSAVGQDITSITTHVFYVLSTLVSSFETALSDAGLSISEELGVASISIVNQSVVKGSTLALKFKADGVEKTSGGTWKILGTAPTGASISGSTLTTTASTPAGDINVSVAYDNNIAEGIVTVTAS